MKLVSVWVRRAPGLDKGVEERRFTSGLNVVFGPNESGKSTLARAIQDTLWPAKKRPARIVDVETRWEHEGAQWTARHDGVTTWAREGEVGPAPTIPGAEYRAAYRLHLRDLIAGEGESDDVFARRIRSTLDGGFDLSPRAQSTPRRSRRHGRSDGQALRDAQRQRSVLEGERQSLARSVEGLGAREAEQSAAEAERNDAAALANVQSWHDARREWREADEWLRADDTPESFGGEALRELDRVETAIANETRALADLDAEIDAAQSRLVSTGLEGRVPSSAELEAWAESSLRAVAQSRELERLRREEEGAAARARQAAADAGVIEVSPPLFAPSREETAQLAQWLDGRERLAAEQRDLDARLRNQVEQRARAAFDDPFEGVEDDALVQARGLVVAYLRANGARGSAWLGLVAAPVAVLPMFSARWPELPPWALPVAIGVGAVVGVGLTDWIVRRHAFRALRRELAALGVESEVAAAAELLDALDDTVRARRSLAEAESTHRALVAQADALGERAAALEPVRADLVARLDLATDVDDLTLVEAARRFAELRLAQQAWAEAKGEREATETERDEGVMALRSALAPWLRGEAPSLEAQADERDADALAAALADLRARITDAKAASAALAGAERQRSLAVERRAGVRRERDALIGGLGVESLDAVQVRARVAAWEERWPVRVRRQQTRSDAAARMNGLEAALGERRGLLELDLEEVRRRREAAEAAAARVAEIARTIGEVRGAAQAAEHSHDLEAASAAVDAATEALAARRREVIDDVAARFMLEEVSADIDRDQRPEVLQRAADLFERFTGHRYALHVDDDDAGGARFMAIDHGSGRAKPLAELSDGTRMQLLLAARLAFVHEGEALVHPPLILDEALSSSDAERMRQVTDALAQEVERGRQVFYMTNDAGDVAIWRAACERAGLPAPNVIRLDAPASAEQDSVWHALPEPIERAPVPAPGGLNASQYAARLRVPPPDAWAPIGEIHLFHLLMDDLETLHRLLEEARVDRLGRFEALARSGAIEGLFGAGLVERVETRSRIAERFLAAWRVGRGQRLRRGDLQGCDVLSDDFKDRFTSLAEDDDVAGDATILMARIVENRDERVKRFRRDKRDEFEAWLIERGYLVEESVLDDDAIAHEVVAQVGDVIVGPGDDGVQTRIADTHALVRAWLDVMHHVGGSEA